MPTFWMLERHSRLRFKMNFTNRRNCWFFTKTKQILNRLGNFLPIYWTNVNKHMTRALFTELWTLYLGLSPTTDTKMIIIRNWLLKHCKHSKNKNKNISLYKIWPKMYHRSLNLQNYLIFKLSPIFQLKTKHMLNF